MKLNHARGLWKYDLMVVFAFAAALYVGKHDSESAEVTAKHEQAAAEAKADIKPADQVWLRLPLECQEWIAMRGAGQEWKRKPVCADLTARAAK
jgi:hypothetical protein